MPHAYVLRERNLSRGNAFSIFAQLDEYRSVFSPAYEGHKHTSAQDEEAQPLQSSGIVRLSVSAEILSNHQMSREQTALPIRPGNDAPVIRWHRGTTTKGGPSVTPPPAPCRSCEKSFVVPGAYLRGLAEGTGWFRAPAAEVVSCFHDLGTMIQRQLMIPCTRGDSKAFRYLESNEQVGKIVVGATK